MAGAHETTRSGGGGDGSSGPRFSVVIPCFNARLTVRRAIQSVYSQTLNGFEVLVVDDGSSDDTVGVALSSVPPAEANKGSLLVFHQQNLGASAARNKGMAEAVGDIIAFLDADDYWMPGYLSKIAGAFEEFPSVGAVSTNAHYMGPRGMQLGLQAVSDRPIFIPGYQYFLARLQNSIITQTSAVSIRRGVVERVGPMRKDLLRAQDDEYWARIAACDVHWLFLPEPLAVIDQTGEQSLSRGFARLAKLPSPETWSRDIWPLLRPEVTNSFRKYYFLRVKRYCMVHLESGLGQKARSVARQALPRATSLHERLFLLIVIMTPSKLTWFLWRLGYRVNSCVDVARTRLFGRLASQSTEQ